MRITLFVDILLPVPINNLFTYRVPLELSEEVVIGTRVIVQFGKKKLYSGLIRAIHTTVPAYEAKYLEAVLDNQPVVTEKQFIFWAWIANYYMCSIGEVMAAALPGGLKLNSETRITLNKDFAGDKSELSDKEFLIVEALEIQPVITLQEAEKILQIGSTATGTQSIVKKLLEKGVIGLEEELKDKYKPIFENLPGFK